jgi:phosphatidylserine/phosphatidylglycerophosphate/cardiolipin synthase-like enzyme
MNNQTHDDGGGSNGSGSDGSGSGSNPMGSGSSTPPGAISIIVEPNGNKGQEVVDAINAAQTSVYMTMYELNDTDVLTALVNRRNAGVDVEVLLDGSNTTRSNNSPSYATLQSGSVPVKYTAPEPSGPFALTHEKTFIVDGATAWIMSMNLDTGPPQYNREYLATDTASADVTEATAIFKSDYANPTGTPITASGDLVVSPSTAGGNSESDLAALVGEATTTVDVEVEELGGTNDLVKAIAAAAKRGVTTHVVVANDPPLDTTADSSITSAGGKLVMTGPSSNDGTASNPYIHGKAILIDCSGTTCKKGFIGSENDSTQSLLYNRELGVIFTDTAELAKVKTAIDTDFAAGTEQ